MKIRKSMVLCSIVYIASLLSSCEKIYDEPQGCGLFLDFKYDYNMLYADAFHSQVERVDVYVFDRDSNFVMKKSERGKALAASGYRMAVNIPSSKAKEYIVMAWAGTIDHFNIIPDKVNPATISELKLNMKQQESGINNTDIGSLWYGEIRNVNYLAQGEQTETINLIKDTNRFRIVLQKVGEGTPISVDDMSFIILTNNAFYNYKNEIVPTHLINYQPYFTDDIEEVGAVAELNTMRLVADNPIQLIIRDNKNNKELLDINLMNYLLATKMEGHNMSAQEYLDRQSEFTIILFYNMVNNVPYLSAKIVVNNWTTWLQNEEI